MNGNYANFFVIGYDPPTQKSAVFVHLTRHDSNMTIDGRATIRRTPINLHAIGAQELLNNNYACRLLLCKTNVLAYGSTENDYVNFLSKENCVKKDLKTLNICHALHAGLS
jgi:hypothetical protein